MGIQFGRRATLGTVDPNALGRRRAFRAEIDLPATADTVAGPRRVYLHDLSCTGAMLEGPGLPPVGSDLVIKCAGTAVFGIVVWGRNGRCGVRFDRPIDAADIARMRVDAAEHADTGITPEQQQAAEDWARGRTR
jgi:hypothetical protein